jgi:hypothetical protein
MKTFFIILYVLYSTNIVMAQYDTIIFKSEKNRYEQIAQERLVNLYKQEKNGNTPFFGLLETNRIYVSPSMFLSSKYVLNQLKIISIPILGWNQQSYKSGDKLETLIAFKQDFLFQMVFVVTKEDNLKVGAFEIFDSYNEENRKKDSINNVPFSLHGSPVMSDNKKIEKKIHTYILENPNVFVFMIRDLHGYWAVIEGELVKLVYKGCKIKGEPGSEFVCKRYGQEFINDAITDSIRTGYRYLGYPDCKVNESIKIDIKN